MGSDRQSSLRPQPNVTLNQSLQVTDRLIESPIPKIAMQGNIRETSGRGGDTADPTTKDSMVGKLPYRPGNIAIGFTVP